MAQEGNADLGGTFSTLNINAMEFVPSFRPRSAAAPTTSPTPQDNPSPSVAAVETSPNGDDSSATAAAVKTNDAAAAINNTSTTNSAASSPINSIANDHPYSLLSSSTAAPAPTEPAATNDINITTTPTSSGSSSPTSNNTPTTDAAAATSLPDTPAGDHINIDDEDSNATVEMATAVPSEIIVEKTPENAESDPLDSWDNEDEPVTTPEDEEADDLDGENGNVVAAAKKKVPKVEENKSKKEHVNVVFIGHVDAGKSTIGGQIMSLTGMVDKRTLEKNQREAREKSRESWYLSWALDTNQEERDKGKTVEVGRAYFETEKKHFTILDAPGHKSFVPNMIGGAAQADLAVLVLSARKGEFETGFDRGGQTREHAMLAKTAGVKHLVVLINKMDDPTVLWEESRYNECKDKILPYLKKLGFNPAKDLTFMPVSGLAGHGILDQIPEDVSPWYRGPAFIPFIDQLPSLNRKQEGPFIMPIVDKYKDMGTVVMGKVESGMVKKGQNLLVMPNRTSVSVDQIWSDDEEVSAVGPGENVKIKLKGIEEDDVSPGFVLCDSQNPITTGKKFDAQVVILEHKSIICAGYSAVMHIHCAAEEITVNALICLVDKKTGDKSKTRPRFVKQDQVAIMRIECSGLICLEQFKLFPQMGRFTLRDENKTIAIGKVLKVIE